MEYYFVRHGKAGQVAPNDALRPLTPEGTRTIERAGQLLQRSGIHLDYVFASPRLRAQQTATILAAALHCSVTTREEVNFEFDVSKVQQLVVDLPSDAAVMFVGHNPSMSDVVHQITGARVDMPTGGIVCARGYSSVLTDVVLRWFVTPHVYDVS